MSEHDLKTLEKQLPVLRKKLERPDQRPFV